jgi:signal transduction histidine kinase
MNDMVARLEAQLQDHKQLLASVSHELRTPLGHMRLLIEMGREAPNTKTLDEMEREIVELDALAGQLLASSRLDFGIVEKSTHDVTELAQRALERAGCALALLHVHGGPATVRVDATLVLRALANLLENARSHAGGPTALHVTVEPTRVSFVVDDNGPGLPVDAAHIFEPFYRRPSTTSEQGALGLGLALVKRVALAHAPSGGVVVIAENRAEGGARVGFAVARGDDA